MERSLNAVAMSQPITYLSSLSGVGVDAERVTKLPDTVVWLKRS
jgi:hypothetical protein